VILGIGGINGFFAGANWAEWSRARSDGEKAMRSHRDHRK